MPPSAPVRAPISVAVIGAGVFGRNHLRVYEELSRSGHTRLAAVVDTNAADTIASASSPRALAQQHNAAFFSSVDHLLQALRAGTLSLHAASVCVPTIAHAAVVAQLLEAGIDVLVEKPFTSTLAEADALLALAAARHRILQVGHLERFNPAVTAVLPYVTGPMFFECHRLSIFTPRSLDVDVVLDLMIHDLDIVLFMARSPLREIRAVGLPILSPKVDIANVRIEFESGCVANFTASRVSTERVRKLRFFQPHQYVSVDYARQDAFIIEVNPGDINAQNPALSGELDLPDSPPPGPALSFQKLSITPGEPLRLEIESFLHSVRTREAPAVPAQQSRAALAAALAINQEIADHRRRAGLH
jgi:predicted dehydrogenase